MRPIPGESGLRIAEAEMTEFRLGSYRVNDKGLWDFRMAKEPLNKDSLMEYRQNTKVIIDLQPV